MPVSLKTNLIVHMWVQTFKHKLSRTLNFPYKYIYFRWSFLGQYEKRCELITRTCLFGMGGESEVGALTHILHCSPRA